MKKFDPTLEETTQKRLDILKEMPERNAASAARGRTQFLTQAKIARASLSEPVSLWGRLLKVFQLGWRPVPALNWVTAVILALVIFFASGAATVYASQGSLPGDGLYPVKLLSEDGLLFLTVSPAARLNLTLDLTDRRMAEITQLRSAGRPIPASVIDRFNAEMDQSLELAAQLQNAVFSQSLASVSTHAQEQLKMLERSLEGKKPPVDLANTQTRLQEQVQEAKDGQIDPQEFRQEYGNKSNPGHDQPGKNTPDDLTDTPTLTATSTSTTTPTSTITPTPTVTLTPTARPHKPTHTPKHPDPKENPGSSHKPTPNH